MNYLQMWSRIKRFVLVVLVLLALANLMPGDGDKQDEDRLRKHSKRSEASKLSRRTDPGGGGGARRDLSADEPHEHAYSPTMRPTREHSVDNQLDLLDLLAGENPTSTPDSVNESELTTASESEAYESTPSNRSFATTMSSLAEALSVQLGGSLSIIELPEEAIATNEALAASLTRPRSVITKLDSPESTKNRTTSAAAEHHSSTLGPNNEVDPHLVRNKKSPKPNSTQDSSSEPKLSSSIVALNSSRSVIQKAADSSLFGNALDHQIHYDNFDPGYQLKLNATNLLSNSETMFALSQPTKQEPGPNPQNAPSLSKVKSPNWSNLVGPLSHLFDSTDSLNMTPNAASASDIGPVPSVMTLKIKLTKQELNTIKPQLLSMYQDSFEPGHSPELSQPANGDLLATASNVDAIAQGSLILNGSMSSVANLSNGVTDLRNETSRYAILNLLNGSPVITSNQKSGDFPSIVANHLVADSASIDPMLSSSSTSKPSTTTTTTSTSTSTTGTPSVAPTKGPSDNNHWFNYPHPRRHHNPLLLHHLINKPAVYAPNIQPQFDFNQTTTTTSAPETRAANNQVSTRPPQTGANTTGPTVIERPSQSRSFPRGAINRTQLEMQLDDLRALASRQRLQQSNPLGSVSSQHTDYTSFKLADRRQKAPFTHNIQVSSNSVPFHANPAGKLSFAMHNHRVHPNSLNSRQPIQLPLNLANQNTGPISLAQSDPKQNQLLTSQVFSAPSLLQELYSTQHQSQPQWPNVMSSSNRIAQISSSFNHSTPSVANVQSLDELVRLVELYHITKQQSVQGLEPTLNWHKNNEFNHKKSLNNDDQMSTFVSNLSTWYMNQTGTDFKGPRDNLMYPNQASKSGDQFADHIQLFSLPEEEQAKLLRDFTINKSRPADNPNSNHNSRVEAEVALQVLALAAFLKRDKDFTANKYPKIEHNSDVTMNVSHLDALRLLASLQSNNRPTDPSLKPISNHNHNPTSNNLNSQTAEPSSSAYTGKYNNFDDNPHSLATMKNSNHQESERQVVQESLLVESSRVNPFGRTQRSSYHASIPFGHVGSPSFRPQFVGPTYIQPPSSFRVVPPNFPVIPGYQLAASQMSRVQQSIAMGSVPPPPPQLSLLLPQTSQSRPAFPLIAPPPPITSGPDPAKLLVDRFPFVSAPAYLIKLPTLTGGTITASGSFKTPVSLLRNRYNPSPLELGSRMRIVTTSQPAQPGAQISTLPIQMSPSSLHPLHHSPPTRYGPRAPIIMSPEADHYVSPTPSGSRFHPTISSPMYPHSTQFIYDHQPQLGVAPAPMQKFAVDNHVPNNHPSTTSSFNHTEQTDSITATGTTPHSTGYNNNKLTHQNSDTSNAFKANNQPAQSNSQTNYRTFAGSDQLGTVSIQPTVANAALIRLQQATASLVELTSLASLVDEILSSTDREPSHGAALMNAIKNLSLTQNPAMSAQASSSSGTINDSNPNPGLALSTWRNLLNAGFLWRDKMNINNNLNEAKIERLVVNANQKPTTRLRVKYIRVPVAIYETTNGDQSWSGSDSIGSNELILATRNPMSAKSFVGQVSLPAVPITAGSLGAVSSISDQLHDAKSGSLGSGTAVTGNSKSASSNSYMFDEMSSDSSAQLAVTARDLLESDSHSSATNRPVSFDSNPPLILDLQARRPGSVPLLIKPRVPLSLVSGASSLLRYQPVITASSSPDLQAIDSIATVKEIGASKRGRAKGRTKGYKEHLDINDDDDEDENVSGDDLMSADDLSLLESLISTVSHHGASSSQYPYQYKHSVSSPTSHRTPVRNSSPWRLLGVFSAFKNMGTESSNQVETFALLPTSVSSKTANNKDFATSLLKHSNTLSLGEIIGALSARRLIMGLFSQPKASRTTSKRAVSPANEPTSDVYMAAKLKGPKIQATNNSTSPKATAFKGVPSMYPYIGTFESSVQKGQHFNRQHQAAMTMVVNRNRQHNHRNERSK